MGSIVAKRAGLSRAGSGPRRKKNQLYGDTKRQRVRLPDTPSSPTDGELALEMANESNRTHDKKVEFLKPLQDGHKCTLCRLLLRAPLQTDCGHRFCLQCFYTFCGFEVCPEDNTDLTWKNVHKDKFCENEIKALEVFCQNRQNCGWTGTLESLQVCVSFCRDSLIHKVKKMV